MTTDTGTAVDHYDRLLAEHYAWMMGGDVHEAADRQATLLTELGLAGLEDGGTAIDLGCGSGAQTLALVRLGFSPVIAIDTSSRLLDELVAHVQGTGAVRPVHGDIRTVLPETAEPGTVAAIVCMGDTLPPSRPRQTFPVLLGHIGRALASVATSSSPTATSLRSCVAPTASSRYAAATTGCSPAFSNTATRTR